MRLLLTLVTTKFCVTEPDRLGAPIIVETQDGGVANPTWLWDFLKRDWSRFSHNNPFPLVTCDSIWTRSALPLWSFHIPWRSDSFCFRPWILGNYIKLMGFMTIWSLLGTEKEKASQYFASNISMIIAGCVPCKRIFLASSGFWWRYYSCRQKRDRRVLPCYCWPFFLLCHLMNPLKTSRTNQESAAMLLVTFLSYPLVPSDSTLLYPVSLLSRCWDRWQSDIWSSQKSKFNDRDNLVGQLTSHLNPLKMCWKYQENASCRPEFWVFVCCRIFHKLFSH